MIGCICANGRSVIGEWFACVFVVISGANMLLPSTISSSIVAKRHYMQLQNEVATALIKCHLCCSYFEMISPWEKCEVAAKGPRMCCSAWEPFYERTMEIARLSIKEIEDLFPVLPMRKGFIECNRWLYHDPFINDFVIWSMPNASCQSRSLSLIAEGLLWESEGARDKGVLDVQKWKRRANNSSYMWSKRRFDIDLWPSSSYDYGIRINSNVKAPAEQSFPSVACWPSKYSK